MNRSLGRRTAVALLVGALTLAACGSDSDEVEEDVGTGDEISTTDAPEDNFPEEEVSAEPADISGTIVGVATDAGTFNTLVAAVGAAELVDTLTGDGPFTVFAPTDDAFAALPDGLVDALLLPENQDALRAILTYHVLGAEILSADVAPGDVATVQGENITIAADGAVLSVNQATITAVDVQASNGVIHVIDQVLVPPSVDATALLAE